MHASIHSFGGMMAGPYLYTAGEQRAHVPWHNCALPYNLSAESPEGRAPRCHVLGTHMRSSLEFSTLGFAFASFCCSLPWKSKSHECSCM
mmetsp:Transcript_76071/g.150754  ORF Transcript_76071/g.150754 Transcript_76071/m.150754 type:complete len:90 (+) Transcript_76071:336-605(+)